MRYLVLTALCAAIHPSFSLAQIIDSEPAMRLLEPMISTATLHDDSVFETPYTAHVVDSSRFIEQRWVRSLADGLTETPGIFVQKTGYGQASPFIRGFTGFRTLLLIDGIRLNNAVFREGPNQYFSTIDQFTIDRLEIVKGPASTLYGSDAIGGTINAITRNPRMLPWPQTSSTQPGGKSTTDPGNTASPENFAIHGGAYYRHATAENSHTTRGEFGFALGPHLGVLGGMTWKDFDDLRGGSTVGSQTRSGYTEIDGDIKVVFRLDHDAEITAAFYRVEQNNVPRWHSTIHSNKGFDGVSDGTDLRRDLDQVRELAYIRYERRDAAPWLTHLRFTLSFHRQFEEQDRIRSDGRREIVGFQDDQFGILLNLESPVPFGTVQYGIEYYHDTVQSWGSRWNASGSLASILPRGPVSDGGSYDQLGIYLQTIFKPVEPLEVTLGVRYSWIEARGGMVDNDPADSTTFPSIDKVFDAITGSARFRLDLTRDWNLFGGVSQGFRAPNLSDLTSFEIARSGEQETPAPALSPEHYVSFEIGTKYRHERLRLEGYVSYFHTLIDNQIIRYPTGRIVDELVEVQKANIGDGFIHGVEIGAEWNFHGGFTLFGNLSWAEGELDTFEGRHLTARPASRIQPLTGLAGLRWESSDRRWFIEGTAQLVRHQDRLAPGDVSDTQRIPPGGTRGYHVFSIRAGWKPSDGVQMFAAVENISDEDYRIHGSGINEAGTNVILGTRLTF
jgi:hemoglobin/transferrin/lactoferrin receptor protein